MARPKPSSRDGFISSTRLNVVRVLLAGAACIAVYLAYVSAQGDGVAGCGPASGCHEVLNSRWSYWFRIPVSAPAALAYLGLFGLSFLLSPTREAAAHRKGWGLLVAGAWVLIGAALWFVGLQVFVIKAFCFYCVAAHTLGVTAAVILLLSAPFRPIPEKPWERERHVFLPRRTAIQMAALGGVIIAGLILGQTVFVRPATRTAAVSSQVTEAQNERLFEIFDGRFKLDVNDVPIIGDPKAENVMLSLFDYTCHYCRTMHPRLLAAQQIYSNKLAIINLPMPLDDQCNVTINRGQTPPAHSNACQYAMLSLAVWKTDRAKLAEFDEWMFKFQSVPPLADARVFAQNLVGADKLTRNLSDPWVRQQLDTTISIYATAYTNYHNGSMPQLIVGTNITSGILTMEQLFKLLGDQFKLETM